MESLLISCTCPPCLSCCPAFIFATPLLLIVPSLVLRIPPRFLSYPAFSISTSLASGGERTIVCMGILHRLYHAFSYEPLCSISSITLTAPCLLRVPMPQRQRLPHPPSLPSHPSQTPSPPLPSSASPSRNSYFTTQWKKNAAGAHAVI